MVDDTNPYQSPAEAIVAEPIKLRNEKGLDRFAFVWWPIVFGLNFIVPTIAGLEISRDSGRVGVALAVIGFLAIGWGLCYTYPGFARRLIIGSGVFALSQLFPIIQMIAGIVGIRVAHALGFIMDNPEYGFPERITSELGGLVITVIVGGILLSCSAVLGLFLSLFLPRSWFGKRPAGMADT